MILFHTWCQLKKAYCSSPKAHKSHAAICNQTHNQVPVLSPSLFFQVLLVSALPSDLHPAASPICLSSRNSLSGFWQRPAELQTSLFHLLDAPSYHSWHNTLGCQLCKGVATFQVSCWEYVPRPAWRHVAALCMQALWGFVWFQPYTSLVAQAQKVLCPELAMLCTWDFALVRTKRLREAIRAFTEEGLGPPRKGEKKNYLQPLCRCYAMQLKQSSRSCLGAVYQVLADCLLWIQAEVPMSSQTFLLLSLHL